MKRLIIAIDCDDVLVRTTQYIVDKYNEEYNTSVRLGSAHAPGNLEWSAGGEEVHRRIDSIQLSEAYGQLAPTAQAVDAVSELAGSHELHLITSRAKGIESVTQRMIDKYFSHCFTSVKHVGYGISKEATCRRVNAEVLIDDNLKHLLSAQTVGISNLLWFGHYPWQDRSVVPEGISVVSGWTQVVEHITRLSHE